MAKRTPSSRRWLREHFTDPWVQRTWDSGYRSRAAWKLLEIDRRDRILRPGMTVIDLGAAPGGWSQIAAKAVGLKGRVIALDCLEMEPLAGVTFIQGDFREETILEQLRVAVGPGPVDLVLSDMAPNISGMKAVDQPRVIALAELALDFARETLRPGGDLLLKLFQGEGFDAFVVGLKRHFARIVFRKPEASRARSAEVYVLARNRRV